VDHQVQVATDCESAVQTLTGALETQGLRVYRSFDLRTALTSLPDCGCPHHGTDQCTCQFAVLLVYGHTPSPVHVVAHGHDGQTWLSVLQANGPSATLQQRILAILTEIFPRNRLNCDCHSAENPSDTRTFAHRLPS
jgi:hypothetical protein